MSCDIESASRVMMMMALLFLSESVADDLGSNTGNNIAVHRQTGSFSDKAVDGHVI